MTHLLKHTYVQAEVHEITRSSFSSKARCGAYREDFLRSQSTHLPLSVKLSLQYKGPATWARVCLPLACHSLDRIVGLNLP